MTRLANPLAALVWKEWHEVRAFLWIAMGVFILLPILGGLEGLAQYSRHFEFVAMPWVVGFGGVLAVFVAVGVTCRDLTGPIETFWRSRPVSVTRWLTIKYVIGLVVVLVGCILPLAIEFAVSSDRDESLTFMMGWFPFYGAALYSIGFLAGCLVRRTSQAAMLALAAMLLVYFLPVVLPPLAWLSVPAVSGYLSPYGPSDLGVMRWKFAAGMAGISIAMLALALWAVRRDRRIASGQKLMYGSVSLAILILVSSAAFQLGTNMPILQEVALPPGENVYVIRSAGNHGIIVTRQIYHLAGQSFDESQDRYRTFDVTRTGVQLGDPRRLNERMWWWGPGVSPPANLGIRYFAYEDRDSEFGNETCRLRVNELGGGFDMLLWEQPGAASPQERRGWNMTCVWENRLYVIGSRLVTLDIGDPRKPRIISSAPFHFAFEANDGLEAVASTDSAWTFAENSNVPWKMFISLPPVPQVPPMQRLEAVLSVYVSLGASNFDGQILCKSVGNSLVAYRLTQLTGETATFEPIGRYTPTILESVFGNENLFGMQMENGLLYLGDANGGFGVSPGVAGGLNPHISVFDLRGNPPLRLIGHFAAPGAGVVCPLPDGRALVGGTQLWLIGPPPHRGD